MIKLISTRTITYQRKWRVQKMKVVRSIASLKSFLERILIKTFVIPSNSSSNSSTIFASPFILPVITERGKSLVIKLFPTLVVCDHQNPPSFRFSFSVIKAVGVKKEQNIKGEYTASSPSFTQTIFSPHRVLFGKCCSFFSPPFPQLC